MRKLFKKILAVGVASALTAGTLSLAACAPKSVQLSGMPDGKASSNGGFVVSVDDSKTGGYYYFINGVETYTSDNTYGTPVKGSLMRVKKSELKENKAETVIPSLMVAGDYTAGIFIYGERVYYATPTNVRNTSGVVENTYLDFKSAKLDGSDIQSLFRLASNTTIYRFVEVEGTVYVLYAEGSSTYTMHSVNTEDGTDTVLFAGATSYLLDSENKENPVVYYTMNVIDRQDSDGAQTQLYNQVYRVSAEITEKTAYYEYEWDQDWLDENNGGQPMYTNLGEIVLDGIGGNDKKTQFNHSDSDPLSPIGYSYSLRSYKNGGVYFTRTQTSGVGGDLYYLAESHLASGWDSVKDNATDTGAKLTKLANAIDAKNKATDAAYFYTEGEGANLSHHYLYVSNSSIFRVDVGENGSVANDLAVAYDIGTATIVGIDQRTAENRPNEEYDYVYFTRSGASGLTVERAVYSGNEDNYKNLTFEGENNAAYKPAQVLDVQHVSSWYNFEIIDDIVFYADAESFGGNTYSYTSCVSLKDEDGGLMDNVELEAFNGLYKSITDTTDKTVGLFAKLNDAFGDSDLSNAIKYYFYTGETEQFDENIAYAIENGQRETALYTEEEQAAFAAFAAGGGYTYTKNGEDTVLFTADNATYRTYDYFRTQLGERSEADRETYAEYWKTSGLNHYIVPASEDTGLAWWAWLLIGIAIALVVVAAAGFCVWFFVIRKKGQGETVEKLKVVTKDDKNIDVYAEETPEEEATEEVLDELPEDPEANLEDTDEIEVPAEETEAPAEEEPAEETPEE